MKNIKREAKIRMKATNLFKVIITAFLVVTFTVSVISCKEASVVKEVTGKPEETLDESGEEEIKSKEGAERNPIIKISSIEGYDVDDNKIEFEGDAIKGDVDLILVTLKISDFDIENDSVLIDWRFEDVLICRINGVIKKDNNTYLTAVTTNEINTYKDQYGILASETFDFIPSGSYKCEAILLWLTTESKEIKYSTDSQEFKIERKTEEEISNIEDENKVYKETVSEESDDSIYNNEEEILNQIMEKARSDWPDDYEMQNYQYDNQVDAYYKLKNLPNTSNFHQEILSKAQSDWPDDYEMQLYQYNNQLEAYNEIQGLPNTDNYRDEILLKARGDWPDDYEMQLYQYNKQLEAYLKIQQLPYTSNFNRSALSRAQSNWPNDYEMQLYQYHQEVD